MKHDFADFALLILKRCGFFWPLLQTAKRAGVLYLAVLLLVPPVVAETNCVPVFQFAIFYNSLLEFTTCAPLTIAGRVHANSNIFVGSSNPLIFNNTVSTTGTITNPPWAGWIQSQYTSPVTYNGSPAYVTNAPLLQLPIGADNTPDAVREIINMPPPGEDVNSAIGQSRYYNQADIVLLVSNTTVTAMIKTSPTDTPTNIVATYNPANNYASNYVQVTTNFPFLNLTNLFTDQRESDVVKVTQINVGAYNKWLITNPVVTSKFPNSSGVYSSTGAGAPNILYVADNRTYGSGQLTAVRLQNASVIPTNMVNWGASSNQPSGFTVATPNPLYVWGNYNNAAGSTYGYLTPDGTSTEFPASLVSDAITVLSSSWLDSASGGSYSSRNATSTTINAAILAGVVYSTGSSQAAYSGGAHNLTRLLENWTGDTLTLNTSLVNLFNSVRATSQFQFPGVYYQVPKQRNLNFDLNFLQYTRLPPGTPLVCATQTTPPATPVLNIAPMSFLTFSNLTLGGIYQLQQSAAWYWSNQSASFTATNSLYTQMVAGVASGGDYRLALSPVPAQAFATPQVVNGFVVGATVTDGGSGYVTPPGVSINGDTGSDATAVASISGGAVTGIIITSAGIGYTNMVTVEIDPPPVAALSSTVQPVMRVDSTNLSPYDNYQIQFTPDLGGAWENWNGGLFSPTDVTNSQYLFITNGVGFFRLQHLP